MLDVIGISILLIVIWLLFLLVPIWLLGIFDCRRAAWWDPSQRIKRYIDLPHRPSRLLIPRYWGFNDKFKTNIPFFYGMYYVNEYPQRLSILGLADYCVTGILGLWYGIAFTVFFFGGPSDAVPYAILTLMVRTLVMFLLINWNDGKMDGKPITKMEPRARQQANRKPPSENAK